MDKDKLLQKYLDGELSPDKEREALHIFADDADMRAMLRFEQQLQHSFQTGFNPESFEVPEGFSDRVMHTIEEQLTDTRGQEVPEFKGKVREWVEWVWKPQPVQWRPVYVAFIVLLLMVSFSLPNQSIRPAGNGFSESVQPVSKTTDKVLLRFVFIDSQANSVEVAGDFNNWEPVPLTKQIVQGEQVWTGLLEMNRGEHQYMFIRNGKEWVTDPLAPVQQDDGFGNKNAVIYL